MIVGVIPLLLLFLTPGTDMGKISTPRRFLVNGNKVKGLITTEMLRRLFGGSRTFCNDGVQGLSEQLHVVLIGSRHNDRQGYPMPFRQDAPFGPLLATVRGIGARGLPPKGALFIAPSMLCHVHSSPCNSS